MNRRLPSHRQSGLTLLEVAIVLVVVGLLVATASTAFSGAGQERTRAKAMAVALEESLRTYLLANRRLPCPDQGGDGWEDRVANECPAGLVMGFVPYASLGLTQPEPNRRALYGVGRFAGADPTRGDLTHERLIEVLARSGNQPVTTALPYLTGNGGRLGAVDCQGNVLSNPAFVLVLPVGNPGGGDGFFEFPHDSLLHAGRCIVAPGNGGTLERDDLVLSASAFALTGWLKQH